MSSPNDRRTRSRYLPVFELRVLEQVSGRDLGLLVDASPNGLRIACPEALKKGSSLLLSIEAGPEGGSASVNCKALVRWCKTSEAHPTINIAGLELQGFETMTSENELLRMLISECIQAA